MAEGGVRCLTDAGGDGDWHVRLGEANLHKVAVASAAEYMDYRGGEPPQKRPVASSLEPPAWVLMIINAVYNRGLSADDLGVNRHCSEESADI